MQSPKDVRLPLMVSETLATAIDAWWHANRLASRAEGIRQLIERGLSADAAPDSAKSGMMPTDGSPLRDHRLPKPDQLFPRRDIIATPASEIYQLNTKISKRLDKQLSWIAQQKGTTKRDVVTASLDEFVVSTLNGWGQKPIN